jgi:hypothetical protein
VRTAYWDSAALSGTSRTHESRRRRPKGLPRDIVGLATNHTSPKSPLKASVRQSSRPVIRDQTRQRFSTLFHQHAAPLVAPRDELKEQMRRIGFERQMGELVDNQQFRFTKMSEAILEPALAMRLGELD